MPYLRLIVAGFQQTLLIGAALAAVCPAARAGDLSGAAGRAVATARRQAPAAVKFDPAVVPAGGAGCSALRGESGPVRQAGFHHAHAHGCREGMCVPSCPVRPGMFGYYGTQWRRWPAQGVIQTSAVEAATPVLPPKSAVPGADEESPTSRDADAQAEPAEPQAKPEDRQQPDVAPQPGPQGDAAAIDSAGPWSRMIAASSLPPEYEAPALPLEEPGDEERRGE